MGRSNQLLAELLAHLAEVEARGIHRLRACSSLCTYCVYELRWSEDSAFRRTRAARLARKFPIIFQQVADGELRLTALVLLAPHLTEENHRELLALAKYRTKREIVRVVRTLAPEPSIPDRVEPLGPDSIGIAVPRPPSWRALVESLAEGVRELAPGDRPKDWIGRASAEPECRAQPLSADEAAQGRAPAPIAPERFKAQFTASQEYVDVLERVQDLLSHAVPSRSLEEVHLRALRLLVGQLEKPAAAPKVSPSKNRAHPPRRSGPAAVRRDVRDRDGLQCTYVDERGQRCRETRFLELHHELAHALGGRETARNLTMRCQAHNALAAEHDFGREFMAGRREAASRSPLRR